MSPSPKKLSHLTYRPDIDGLRAVAIIFVVGYHTFPDLFKAGFIGVDIFFVISGFLISSIIFDSLVRNNFSYIEFYSRRIRRIFPALLLMLFTFTLIGNWYLLIDEYKTFGKHIIAGATFISNFVTWAEVGYFDTANYSKPFLHLWSLAIEEQFYIFWPLILGLLWKRKKGHKLLAILAVIGLLSFCFNLLIASSHPTADFYSPFSRFWELMIGGFLAYLVYFKSKYFEYSNHGTSILGAILIIGGLFFIDYAVVYPGWWALFPTIGTFLLILAGPDCWLNKNILSHKFLVWVGLISYPLYLWHWPLLSFARILFGQNLSINITLFIIILSLFLSWLTYILIEKPIKSTRHSRRTTLILISLMCIVCIFGLIIKLYGFPNRHINRGQLLYNESLHSGIGLPWYGTVFSDRSCENFLGSQFKNIPDCRANSHTPQVLFGGDSHAAALYSSIQGGEVSLSSVLISGGSCPLYLDIDGISEDCIGVIENFILTAQMFSITDILLINTTAHITSPNTISNYIYKNKQLTQSEAFLIGYSNLLDKLTSLNKNIIYVLDIPHLTLDPRNCIQRSKLHDNSKKDCSIDFTTFKSNQATYIQLVSQLKEKYPELIIYDAAKNLCNNSKCLIRDEINYFYFDNNHLTMYGSKKILSDLMNEINILSD